VIDGVVIISPELRPGKGGVGDYTLRLVERWPDSGNFKVLVPAQGVESGLSVPIHVVRLADDTPTNRDQLPAAGGKVLVQYSAYGFDPLGYPRRLIQALLGWKKETGGLLVIVFHEIWTFWPVLNKNAPVQYLHRRAIRQLVKCADAVFTTTRSQAKHLNELASNRSVQVLPVGSNIRRTGDPKLPREKGHAILFGLQPTRLRTLKRMKSGLSALAAVGRLSKIIAVGAGDPNLDAEEARQLRDLGLAEGFEQRGSQSESVISELLLTSAFGISAHDELSYEKSGTFMAYAAHELNVLNECADTRKNEPLCWLVGPAELQGNIADRELTNRAKQLRAWQQRISSWDSIAAKLSEALQGNRRTAADELANR
jgi:hypothetical protein